MTNDNTDVYLRLDYRGYKHLEAQLRDWEAMETSHTTVDGFYHKALRIEVGTITFEFQGPAVKEPIREYGFHLDGVSGLFRWMSEWITTGRPGFRYVTKAELVEARRVARDNGMLADPLVVLGYELRCEGE